MRQRALAAIDLIGLDGFENPPIRRSFPAACASASASPARWSCIPTMLLMDEPFSALDVLTAETLRTDLLDLWGEGKHADPLRPDGDPQHRGGGPDVRPHPGVLARIPAASRPRSRSTCPSRATAWTPSFRALVDRIYGGMTQKRRGSPGNPRRPYPRRGHRHDHAAGVDQSARRPDGSRRGPAL